MSEAEAAADPIDFSVAIERLHAEIEDASKRRDLGDLYDVLYASKRFTEIARARGVSPVTIKRRLGLIAGQVVRALRKDYPALRRLVAWHQLDELRSHPRPEPSRPRPPEPMIEQQIADSHVVKRLTEDNRRLIEGMGRLEEENAVLRARIRRVSEALREQPGDRPAPRRTERPPDDLPLWEADLPRGLKHRLAVAAAGLFGPAASGARRSAVTVGDVRRLSDDDLREVEGVGPTALARIRRVIGRDD